MHFLPTRVYVILLLYSLTGSVSAAQPDKQLLADVKNLFVDILLQTDAEFEICEAYSKLDDKRKFLNAIFKNGQFEAASRLHSAEIFVTRQQANARLHLGVIVLTYAANKDSHKLYSRLRERNEEYFPQTKILTRYQVHQRGNLVLLVYSETASQDELRELFSRLESTL